MSDALKAAEAAYDTQEAKTLAAGVVQHEAHKTFDAASTAFDSAKAAFVTESQALDTAKEDLVTALTAETEGAKNEPTDPVVIEPPVLAPPADDNLSSGAATDKAVA